MEDPLPIPGQSRSVPGQCRSLPANLGRIWPTPGQQRSNVGRAWPICGQWGQSWANAGRNWLMPPNRALLGQSGPNCPMLVGVSQIWARMPRMQSNPTSLHDLGRHPVMLTEGNPIWANIGLCFNNLHNPRSGTLTDQHSVIPSNETLQRPVRTRPVPPPREPKKEVMLRGPHVAGNLGPTRCLWRSDTMPVALPRRDTGSNSLRSLRFLPSRSVLRLAQDRIYFSKILPPSLQ